MKNLILFSIVSLLTLTASAQCSADFTWSVSGSTIQFTNTSTGTFMNDWSFGDGGSSTSTNPTYTYSSPGTYSVCLYTSYIDSVGGFCSDSTCYQVTALQDSINGPCNADFTWSVSGNTVQFTNTSSGTNMNDWSFGEGGSSTATNPTYTYSNPGNYWVCLYSSYTDSVGGFCSDSTCHQITILQDTLNTPCNANFTWSVSGNTVQFTNTSSGTNMNDWSFGEGGSSTATNPTYTYSNPGNYWVCLYSSYTDSVGGFCSDSTCHQITILQDTLNTPCNANFTWSVSGNTVQFTNTSSGTNMNDWSFGDGGSSIATNPTYTYSNPGNYWVCLYSSYTDSVGGFCSDSTCHQITILQDTLNTPCNADFTWSVSGNTVQFTNTSSGTNMNDWSFGDGGSSTTTNPTYTYSNPGNYWVCLYSSYTDSVGGFCSDSTCHQITILQDSTNNGCTAIAYVYGLNGGIFANNGSTGASSFDWTVYDNNSGAVLDNSQSTDLSYYPGYYGEFLICLSALDSIGMVCDSTCEILTIEQDSLDSTANTIKLSLLDFHLYPNPTNSVINIQFDHLPSNSHAIIVDMLGREMIQVDLATQVTEVQVSELPSGIYLVKLVDASNQIIGVTKFFRE